MRRWAWTHYAGDERPYSYDLSAMADAESTTVSSVTAQSCGDVDCTISNSSVSSGIWTGDVLTETAGRAMVKLTATFANGKTRVQAFEITVKGPSISQVNHGIPQFSVETGV